LLPIYNIANVTGNNKYVTDFIEVCYRLLPMLLNFVTDFMNIVIDFMDFVTDFVIDVTAFVIDVTDFKNSIPGKLLTSTPVGVILV